VPIAIRAARAQDCVALREIERLAGERFRAFGMPDVADEEPASVELLVRYVVAGRSWVAADDADHLLGYVLVDDIDGNAHIEQVSVIPRYQGAGVGRALIDQVRGWASECGMGAVTLTTFTHVPWNAPLYRHLGFRVLPEGELGPALSALRDAETARGLDPSTRTCMVLDLTT